MRSNKLLINEKEAAHRYGFSISWFQRARWLENGPEFLKVGAKILYPLKETDEWFLSHRVVRNDPEINMDTISDKD